MSPKARTIVYDCDGVLADTKISVTAAVNRLAVGKVYSYQEVNSWKFFEKDVLDRSGRIDLAERAQKFWYDPRVLQAAPPCPGAVMGVRILRLLGMSQFVATSRIPSLAQATSDWFSHYLPYFVKENRIRMRNDGDDRCPHVFKCDVLAELQPHFFFDDDAEMIAFLRQPENKQRIPNTQVYLVNQPWNKSCKDLGRGTRVSGWHTLLTAILRSILMGRET